MRILAENIRYLRTCQDLSQKELAESLSLSRSNLAKYEKGVHDPGIETLLRMSRYFKISVDALLTIDLSEVDIEKLAGSDKMIFPVQVDQKGNDIIEIVPHDASAGYLGNYSDPEYIEQLDHLYFPFLPMKKKYRAFPVNGDSMPPVIDGSYIIGSWVESIADIKEGRRYIVVSRDEGIVFKRISKIEENGMFHLESDNPLYDSFCLAGQEILEVWEFMAAISIEDAADRHMENALLEKINYLQEEVKRLGDRIVRA
ncbi:XRE family transcriptional regulator [Portibacter marinus]|uniref:XRE family transcriptional regulator n=1 Tax=Portibacter marinus TaxID=2898660 RepID=UPI001F4677F2|nr:helix-turn-helix domain-containing protein [Portibacter marinus]